MQPFSDEGAHLRLSSRCRDQTFCVRAPLVGGGELPSGGGRAQRLIWGAGDDEIRQRGGDLPLLQCRRGAGRRELAHLRKIDEARGLQHRFQQELDAARELARGVGPALRGESVQGHQLGLLLFPDRSTIGALPEVTNERPRAVGSRSG